MSIGLIVVITATAVIAAVLVVAALNERRMRRLREPYGFEYERLAGELGSRRAADRELMRRRRLHDQLDLRPVEEGELRAFAESWDHVQGEFLDDPVVAVDDAGRLVEQALDARGYPAGPPEDRIALASVEDGRILRGFRDAATVRDRVRAEPGRVSTETLRVALTQYRDTFDHLLGGVSLATARHNRDWEVQP